MERGETRLQSRLAKVTLSEASEDALAQQAALGHGGVAPGQDVHVLHRVHRSNGSSAPEDRTGYSMECWGRSR